VEKRNIHNFLIGKPERKGHRGDPSVEDRVILKWILKKLGVRLWIGFIWLKIPSSGELLLTP
jgi:hypothetical protein